MDITGAHPLRGPGSSPSGSSPQGGLDAAHSDPLRGYTYTAGPWRVAHFAVDKHFVVNERGMYVCQMPDSREANTPGVQTCGANARLIAAAPVMHAALSDPEWTVIMATVEDFSNGEVSALVALGVIGMHLLALDHKRIAALSKAEGR